jgi:uncharacterized membrane protein
MPLLVANILVALATVAGLICLIIPGIYIATRLLMTTPLIVDRGLSATDAMEWSWRGLKGQVLVMFLLNFCAAICSMLGFLLCCIGYFITAPIV